MARVYGSPCYDPVMRARHDFRIDGRELVVIDGVLAGARLDHLAAFFDLAPAQRIESDITGADTRLWIIPIERDVAERQPYVAAILGEVAEHFPGESFTIKRAYCNAISYGEVAFVGEHAHARLRGKIIEIAMAAGDGDGRAAGHNARAGDKAFIDGIAEINGEKRL